MTGKDRYEYWEESDTAYDTKIHYGQYFRIIDKKECVRLLNKKEKENNWLKKSIKRQQSSNEECSKYIEELVKENEQLKSTNMEMEDYLGRLEERIIELEKEKSGDE